MFTPSPPDAGDPRLEFVARLPHEEQTFVFGDAPVPRGVARKDAGFRGGILAGGAAVLPQPGEPLVTGPDELDDGAR